MAEIRRNSDTRSLTIDFSKESNPGEAFISAINKSPESFLTSDYDSYLLLRQVDSNSKQIARRYRWEKSENWAITQDTAEKILGLQFIEYQSDTVPSNSTIAYGSKFYSNDEQKAFALKYDCTIAKSPSKTEYYFLNEEEEGFINNVKDSKSRKYMESQAFYTAYLTPSLIKDAVEAYFDDSHNQMHIRETLIQARIWNKLLPYGNDSLLDANGKPLRTNLNVIDAIAYAYKTAMLGKLGYQDSGLSTYTESYSSTTFPDLKYFKMNPTNYYFSSAVTVNNKQYERPLVYEVELTSTNVEKYKNGQDITLTIPLSFVSDWRLIFERSAGAGNYNNSTYIDLGAYILADASISITVNNKTLGLTTLLADKIYRCKSMDYSVVDRLVGFLSENPEIKLVTSQVFEDQLKNESPRLTVNTYDSLFGMICSEDDNTRKTAIKMLQGFDIPNPETPDVLTKYIKDLAVDLIANSNVTGASVNKWLVKQTGSNLNNQPRHLYRNSRSNYTNNPHDMNWSRNNLNPFDFGDRYHPTMSYDERTVANERYDELNTKLNEYFAPMYKDFKKYFASPVMTTPYFSPGATYVINKREEELKQEKPNPVALEQADLFIRHYVNYLINRAFGGLTNNIRFQIAFNTPADLINFKPDAKFVEGNFGEYKRLLAQAKATAIKHPFEFMNLIKDAYSKYELKHSLIANSWTRDREFDYIVQMLHTADSSNGYTIYSSNARAAVANFATLQDAILSLRKIVELDIPASNHVTATI
jgi:hypothetical protein